MTRTGLPPIVLSRRDHDRLSKLLDGAAATLDAAEYLEREIVRARIVDDDAVPPNVVTMHSRLEYSDDRNGERRVVTLVYPGEQDIAQGRISVLTPVGAALLGLSVGQSIEWRTRAGAWYSLTIRELLSQPPTEDPPRQ